MMSYVDDRPFLFRKYVNIDTVLLCRKLSIPAPIFFSHHLLAKSIQSTPLLIYFEVTNTYCCPAKKKPLPAPNFFPSPTKLHIYSSYLVSYTGFYFEVTFSQSIRSVKLLPLEVVTVG